MYFGKNLSKPLAWGSHSAWETAIWTQCVWPSFNPSQKKNQNQKPHPKKPQPTGNENNWSVYGVAVTGFD